ncbi:MAG: hypothetical protein QXT63_02215 [Thermoplasmata archaeon]
MDTKKLSMKLESVLKITSMLSSIVLFIILTLFLLQQLLYAVVPYKIIYQGRMSAGGAPIDDFYKAVATYDARMDQLRKEIEQDKVLGTFEKAFPIKVTSLGLPLPKAIAEVYDVIGYSSEGGKEAYTKILESIQKRGIINPDITKPRPTKPQLGITIPKYESMMKAIEQRSKRSKEERDAVIMP